MKTFTKLTLVAVFVSAAFTAAFGDILTKEDYANANASYDTFQVKTNSSSFSAYELFNFAAEHYTGSSSATGQSVATYGNASDFYAERGVKSLVSDWTVSEGSQIVGMYRTAGLGHSVDLTNSAGTVWNTTVGQGANFGTQGTWIDSLKGGQNIDINAIGTVNMNLTASWKANADVDDPVWATGLSDAVKESKKGMWSNSDFSTTVYGDQPELNGGLISMIAYDVTDLIKAMGYANIENAFMFTWEDWNWGTREGKNYTDFDYNDMVYIMTNVTPNATSETSPTPEPATMLIFGLGLVGVAAARRMKRK